MYVPSTFLGAGHYHHEVDQHFLRCVGCSLIRSVTSTQYGGLKFFWSGPDFIIAIHGVSGQTQGSYTDAATGISFATWVVPGSTINSTTDLVMGFALPPDAATVNSHDYIGLIVSF